MTWLKEPTSSDLQLWKEALEDICLSQLRVYSVGECIAATHPIHPWQWYPESNKILHCSNKSGMMEVYTISTKKLNQYMTTSTCLKVKPGGFCTTPATRRARQV
jgi:hypothetical protein